MKKYKLHSNRKLKEKTYEVIVGKTGEVLKEVTGEYQHLLKTGAIPKGCRVRTKGKAEKPSSFDPSCPVLPFGKYKDKLITRITDRSYLEWLISNASDKCIVEAAENQLPFVTDEGWKKRGVSGKASNRKARMAFTGIRL